MLARQRREIRLQEHRVAERERQRACRKRREPGKKAVTRVRVSRATLPAQAAGILEAILAQVDHAARRSRATLDRQVGAILGGLRPMLDQALP